LSNEGERRKKRSSDSWFDCIRASAFKNEKGGGGTQILTDIKVTKFGKRKRIIRRGVRKLGFPISSLL